VPIRTSKAASSQAAPAISTESPAKGGAFQYATKEEAKEAFKQLLTDSKVRSTSTWEHALRVIAGDKRYGGLKTVSERKKCFEEWTHAQRRVEEEEDRKAFQRAREAFLTMLDQCAELKKTPRFSVAMSLLEHDSRWRAVKDLRDREDIFEDWLDVLSRREHEERKARRKGDLDAFKQLLEDTPWITSLTEWRRVYEKLQDHPRCKVLEKLDCLEVFQAHVRGLEAREAERQKAEREQERQEERKRREAFMELLAGARARGEITVVTKWRDYLKTIEGQEAYQAVLRNKRGSRPRELFEEVQDELDDEVDRAKRDVREYLKGQGKRVEPGTGWEEFLAMTSGFKPEEEIPEKSQKIIWEELVERAKEEEAKQARRKKRALEDFQDLLQHTIRQEGVAWAEARPLLEKEGEFAGVSEEERVALFEEHLKKLAQGDQKEEAPERRSKRRRSTRHRDDESPGHRGRRKVRRHRAEEDDEEAEEGEIV